MYCFPFLLDLSQKPSRAKQSSWPPCFLFSFCHALSFSSLTSHSILAYAPPPTHHLTTTITPALCSCPSPSPNQSDSCYRGRPYLQHWHSHESAQMRAMLWMYAVKWFKNNILAVIPIHAFSSLPLSSTHTPTDLQLPSLDPALVVVACHLVIILLMNSFDILLMSVFIH